MLNMNWKLEQREKEGKIIKTGIVGAGQMGRGMVHGHTDGPDEGNHPCNRFRYRS